MIKVCDAIMGSGKTESTINFINEHPERRFIYLSPYLDEAARIKKGCKSARFVEPSDGIKEYNYAKGMHTHALIQENRNIASTHQAFKFYTSDTLDLIRDKGYTLIIDENVDTLDEFEILPGDLEFALETKYIESCGDTFKVVRDGYSGERFKDLFRLLQSRELFRVSRPKGNDYFYWHLPADLITSFKDVYVLTYLFEGQSMCNLLKMHGIAYQYIGVEKALDGTYHFTDGPSYIPEYVFRLPEMIDLLDRPKLNKIGESPHALSMNWFAKSADNAAQVKNNIGNCFRHIWVDQPRTARMWGTYKKYKHKLQGHGYSNSFVVFNEKALNCYRDRTHLAYCANPFMNVGKKAFYNLNGIDPNEDVYSLSILIQWIWRSAIRDGNPIKLYLPSSRMQELLTDWIDTTVDLANTKGYLSPGDVLQELEQKKIKRTAKIEQPPPANCFIKQNQWERRQRRVQAKRKTTNRCV